MSLSPVFLHRLRWINLPGALLVALLQRTPALRMVAVAGELVARSPVGAVVRAAATTLASLGAVHALAGATQFVINPNRNPVTGTVGTGLALAFTVTGAQVPAGSYRLTGTLPPGLVLLGVNSSGVLNASSGVISGVPTTAGTFAISLLAYEFSNTLGDSFPPAPFALTFTINAIDVPPPSRLSNLSILTSLAASGDSFTLGYVVGGVGTTGSKPLVIRAAGPSLGALGVPGTLDDPKIEVFAGSTAMGENDNWGGAGSVATAMASVGAFAYTATNSKDAAIVTSVGPGDNSVKVLAAGSGTGAVIAEIYDATPVASFTATTPRLVNVSVLKHVGSGLTAGFVIAGSASKSVLIRAVGPGLAAFNVPGVLADPKLELFDGSSRSIATNDNWDGTAALTTGFSQVGAFELLPTSKDAALLASLSPGNYTVQVNGVGNTTGVALIEVYEVP